jgi:aldehyde:ferredoxin oxidoreductase
MGVLRGMDPFTIEGKAKIVQDMSNKNTILHSLLVCDFHSKFIPVTIKDYCKYLKVATGIDFTEKDLYFIAKRI